MRGLQQAEPTIGMIDTGTRCREPAAAEFVGDCVILRLDAELATRCSCPEHLEHLLERSDDIDDATASMRWSLAWSLEAHPIEHVAGASGVASQRIMAFLEADLDRAGELLNFAEAARLLRFLEKRIEDRYCIDELKDMEAIAAPYLEATGLNYAEALRQANAVRDAYRAENPDAVMLIVST